MSTTKKLNSIALNFLNNFDININKEYKINLLTFNKYKFNEKDFKIIEGYILKPNKTTIKKLEKHFNFVLKTKDKNWNKIKNIFLHNFNY